MKELKKYAEEISKAQPTQLVNILIEMTADYGEVCDLLLPVRHAKSKFWLEHKKIDSDKPLSDTTLGMMWMAEDDEKLNGLIQERMELYEKALSRMMSNVKSILREKENEARNLM